MRVKNRYYQQISKEINAAVDNVAPQGTPFREEMFDKLCAFFGRYFCESGSVYFRHIPAFYPARERVYADGRDMELTWKTRGLYYVKSDYLIQSMPVRVGDETNVRRFYFDATKVEHKKNNERRDFVFTYTKLRKNEGENEAVIAVAFSQKGTKTKDDEVLKEMRNDSFDCDEKEWANACAIFRRQTEADFFIHKNAGAFLREQFDMWMYQYIFREESSFGEERMCQLRGLREIAEKIIAFIGQFEDELARVWQKPKFARGGGYVITVNKLTPEVLQKAAKHAGAKEQMQEWLDLGLIDDKFKFIGAGKSNKRFLPLDTKYFKGMEEEILECLGDLDVALDGEMVKSDNWQALNTLRRKYEGRVKCIYIDPPFNLDGSDQFNYRTNYKDANWATMLENRLSLAHDFLAKDGAIFVRCDYHGDHIIRFLMDYVFGHANLKNPIVIKRGKQTLGQRTMYASATDVLYFYCKDKNEFVFNPFKRPRYKWEAKGSNLMMTGEGNPEDKAYEFRLPSGEKAILVPPPNRRWKFNHEVMDKMQSKGIIYFAKSRYGEDSGVKKIVDGKEVPVDIVPSFKFDQEKTVNSNWTDISGYSPDWNFDTENDERVVQRSVITSGQDGIVLDFFAGSGTTQAVAQKLGRKWLGIEMGEHFDTVIIPRLKKVLAGHKSGISQEIEYKGGGAFAYYALEQYEETLAKMRYKDGDLLDSEGARTPFEQYVFLTDDKMAHATKLKGDNKTRKSRKTGIKNAEIDINLLALYDNVNLPQTLANAIGSPLRRCSIKILEYASNAQYPADTSKMTEEQKMELLTVLSPYLWWGK